MRVTVALWVLLAGTPPGASAWGIPTHRWVNESAADLVGNEGLRGWLVRNRERLSDHAIEPDTILRERDGRREAIRHFINLDLYGPPPFASLPRDRDEAERKHGARVVQERGTLPWTILDLHHDLVRAWRLGKWSQALRIAGRAGHYVSDAFMPLHATVNHDGQRTGNDGIHRRVERGLVNRRLNRYASRADRVPRPDDCDVDEAVVFGVLLRSHDLVPGLLRADRRSRGAGPVESEVYFDALDRESGSLLSRRLGEARAFLACFWETAWDAAGRPSPPRSSP